MNTKAAAFILMQMSLRHKTKIGGKCPILVLAGLETGIVNTCNAS